MILCKTNIFPCVGDVDLPHDDIQTLSLSTLSWVGRSWTFSRPTLSGCGGPGARPGPLYPLFWLAVTWRLWRPGGARGGVEAGGQVLTHSGWTNQLEASINNIDQGEASIYLHRRGSVLTILTRCCRWGMTMPWQSVHCHPRPLLMGWGSRPRSQGRRWGPRGIASPSEQCTVGNQADPTRMFSKGLFYYSRWLYRPFLVFTNCKIPLKLHRKTHKPTKLLILASIITVRLVSLYFP